jgi:hypothetical protein
MNQANRIFGALESRLARAATDLPLARTHPHPKR